MTMPRMVGVLAGLAIIGIAVVSVRLAQAAHTRNIQKMEFQKVELQQRLWEQDMELARDLFYAEMEYDPLTGMPTRAGLERLKLADVADELENRGLIG